MRQVPNKRVFSSANQYQDAAVVLSKTDGCLWVAAINAALSIEIYLKSFLVTQDKVDGYEGHKKVKKGHDLLKLYSEIDDSDKTVLKEKLINLDIESELKRYKNLFTHARYTFEPVNVVSIGTDIINLSKAFRGAIEAIIRERCPVNTPPHIQEAVNRALGKR
ncbi:hypothetical protein CWC17_08670 [Pseudoalteromonas sp. S3785]|uniref:hypothetical protein n=1 Tax=Pseudoalteromonas sp. S3785 TaxID=579545 RepID=UPI00110C04D4|nr:hypothetical protein [Pseudoalteromonas sp. S3785]TMO74258.1 hypothetical protein CWC17_08670 [Pseudoalteromonas sp. S3785]